MVFACARTASTLLLAATLAACSTPDPGPEGEAPAAPPPVTVSESPSSSAPSRTATIGQAFDVPGWKVTVSSIRCDTAAKLLGRNADGHTPDVCVAAISYTNTGSGPVGFDQGPDFAGYDQQGRRFDGTRWLQGAVNPGVSDTNELVFDVPPGVKIVAVLIGDVRVG